MNPIQSISSVFRNYVNFSGRAQRSEYWWFTLFSFITQAILNSFPVVGWIYGLVLLLPSLAVTARRLHDTGRSAWWMMIYVLIILGAIIASAALVIGVLEAFEGNEDAGGAWIILFAISGLVSLAGLITILILCALPGIVGPNRYGPDPLRSQQGPGPNNPYAPPPNQGEYATIPASQSEPGQGSEGRRFCTQCGMQLQPEARFCTVCGAAAA